MGNLQRQKIELPGQHGPGRRMIIHDQDMQATERLRHQPWTPLVLPDPEPCGKTESTAFSRYAIDPDIAAHQLDQTLADGQPQSGTAIFARGCTIGLRKRLEQLAYLSRIHADAGIRHGKLQLYFG